MLKLAIDGGTPVRTEPWPVWPVIGSRERQLVNLVLDSGLLQGFAASKGDKFLGGPMVRRFEDAVAQYYGVNHSVSFTSATAALHGAMNALGVGPGDNIVTTPYTFHPSATCALMENAVPLFADVDPQTYNLDPAALAAAINPSTKAVVLVHLFGGPADLTGILDVVDAKDVYLVEDCAQAPGATYLGYPVGTFGQIGILSFVAQKNASSGEGGMLITDDGDIADKARLFRNHAEALDAPTFGYNYRMTELTAAVGLAQFEQLRYHNSWRQELAEYLSELLSPYPQLQTPYVRPKATHVYYVYPLLVDPDRAGMTARRFSEAMTAEGIPWHPQYIRPLYTYPVFQGRGALAYELYRGEEPEYGLGLCPVCEDLSYRTMTLTMVVRPPATRRDMEGIRDAVEKVLEYGRS